MKMLILKRHEAKKKKIFKQIVILINFSRKKRRKSCIFVCLHIIWIKDMPN